jgi:hypothetical protein
MGAPTVTAMSCTLATFPRSFPQSDPGNGVFPGNRSAEPCQTLWAIEPRCSKWPQDSPTDEVLSAIPRFQGSDLGRDARFWQVVLSCPV